MRVFKYCNDEVLAWWTLLLSQGFAFACLSKPHPLHLSEHILEKTKVRGENILPPLPVLAQLSLVIRLQIAYLCRLAGQCYPAEPCCALFGSQPYLWDTVDPWVSTFGGHLVTKKGGGETSCK